MFVLATYHLQVSALCGCFHNTLQQEIASKRGGGGGGGANNHCQVGPQYFLLPPVLAQLSSYCCTIAHLIIRVTIVCRQHFLQFWLNMQVLNFVICMQEWNKVDKF